jgi:hypothetical protein
VPLEEILSLAEDLAYFPPLLKNHVADLRELLDTKCCWLPQGHNVRGCIGCHFEDVRSFSVSYQMDSLQFLNLFDSYSVCSCSLKNLSCDSHVFTQEWHQFFTLIDVRHRLGKWVYRGSRPA